MAGTRAVARAARGVWLQGLPPVADRRARILVLGSMPGADSLARGQYYAHPRNLFWPLMAGIHGFDARADYAIRLRALQDAGVALWDVIGRCRRRGSLDSAIDRSSIQANPLGQFLASHRRIRSICFNGRLAEQAWRRHVAPALDASARLTLNCLPSTSPANASVPLARKRAAWRRIFT